MEILVKDSLSCYDDFKIHAQSDSVALVSTCLICGSTDILQL